MFYKLSLRLIGYFLFLYFGLGIAAKILSLDFDKVFMEIIYPIIILAVYVACLRGDNSSRYGSVINLFLTGVLFAIPVYRILKVMGESDTAASKDVDEIMFKMLLLPAFLSFSFIAISMYLLLTGKLYRKYISN